MIARILLLASDASFEKLIRFALRQGRHLVLTAGHDQLFSRLDRTDPHIIIVQENFGSETLDQIVGNIRSRKKYDHISIIVISAGTETRHWHDVSEMGPNVVLYGPLTIPAIETAVARLLQKSPDSGKKVLVFGDLVIQPDRYTISINGNEDLLPKKEFLVLYLLASEPGRIFSRTEIIEHVWEKGVLVGERTIDVHVRKIRQKIKADYIQTVKSIGYKFSIDPGEL